MASFKTTYWGIEEGILTIDYDIVYSPATIVVAPKSSGYKADRYTDGSNDRVQIQLALDTVSTKGGGVVLLKSGTYTLTNRLNIYSNTVLKGEGIGNTKLIKGNNVSASRLIGNAAYAGTGNSNIFIRDLSIDGNQANQSTTSLGINIDTGSNIFIENVYIHDFRNENIYITDVSEVHCTNVISSSCGRDCFVFDTCSGGAINSCYASNGSTIRSGFYSSNSQNIRFENCQSDSNGYHGFDISGSATTKIIVNGCSASSNGRYGIYCGLGPENCILSNNYTSGGGYGGIGIELNSNIDITGNYSELDSYGIYIDTGNYVNVSGNYVYHAQKDGIDVLKSNYCNVVGNYCLDNGQLTTNTYSDINIVHSGTTYSTYNSINNNVCVCSGSVITNANIKLSSSSNINSLITGNQLYGATNKISGSATGSYIRNNLGYTTESSGLGTISTGKTIGTIAHGLSLTPNLKDIVLTPTNNLGSATKIYLGTAGTSQFTVNLNTDPGADATFAWRSVVL